MNELNALRVGVKRFPAINYICMYVRLIQKFGWLSPTHNEKRF